MVPCEPHKPHDEHTNVNKKKRRNSGRKAPEERTTISTKDSGPASSEQVESELVHDYPPQTGLKCSDGRDSAAATAATSRHFAGQNHATTVGGNVRGNGRPENGRVFTRSLPAVAC